MQDDRASRIAGGLFPSERLERALRWAAEGHRDQYRKGTGTPYIEHPVGVAMILDRAGFPEEVVIAGLLHDLVEDTEATLDEVRERFGDVVADAVARCSETKHDEQGRKRPWIDRKRDHLGEMHDASLPAAAVMLADKLHNLISIRLDLIDGRDVWKSFNAPREQVLWYYRAAIDACERDDPRVEAIARQGRSVLDELGTRSSSS